MPDLKELSSEGDRPKYELDPSTAIEEYRFGEPLTRNNFANFLIDSFAKSRGTSTVQAYSWVWLQRHTKDDIPKLMSQFLNLLGGIRALTDEERALLGEKYKIIAGHPDTKGEESKFYDFFDNELKGVRKIIICQGGPMIKKGATVYVGKMREETLNMEKPDFIRWATTEGQTEQLITKNPQV